MFQFKTSGLVSDGKVNTLGTLKRSTLLTSKIRSLQQYQSKKSEKKPKKSDGKTGIFTKNQYSIK